MVSHPPAGWGKLVSVVAVRSPERTSRNMTGCLRPGLRAGATSLPAHSVGENKLQVQPGSKGWRNTLHLSMRGLLSHIARDVDMGRRKMRVTFAINLSQRRLVDRGIFQRPPCKWVIFIVQTLDQDLQGPGLPTSSSLACTRL